VLLSRAKRLSPAPVSFVRLRLHLFLASCFIYLQFLVPRKIFLNHSDIPYLLILGYEPMTSGYVLSCCFSRYKLGTPNGIVQEYDQTVYLSCTRDRTP